MSEDWIEVAKADDISDEGTLLVDCAGEPVCLYKISEGIFATHDTCSHGMASLADGFIVEGNQIECPLHQGTFDVRNGKMLWRDKLPAGGQATPMTYTVNGRQFLVMVTGNHMWFGSPAGDEVVAYALPQKAR